MTTTTSAPPLGYDDLGRLIDNGDLLLARPADGVGFEVLSVAADDPGDSGPFQSVVYRAARAHGGQLVPATGDRVIAVLGGMKVEALAAGVQTVRHDNVVVHCPFTVATDDEELGGVWRPIAPALTWCSSPPC